jgi:hypothetical protein
MGGNALGRTSVRLTKKNYDRMAAECVAKLRALYPDNRATAIEAYRAKYDFGDLDILVESTGYDPHAAAEALGAHEVVRNGPTTSIGVLVREDQPYVDGNVFQVDLVSSDSASFDYAKAYFSFNDLGNLVGRTAHRAGLAHRHDGLYYYVRDGDYKFRELMLTQNYDTALSFLGYEPARFHAGFETLTDIFEYVTGSAYFHRDIFLLENRNYQSRVRDRKRKTYTDFLAYCEARPDLPAYAYPESKSAWLPRIFEQFPQFKLDYEKALQDMANQGEVKKRFNGEFVGGLTGLEGKTLGMLMKHVKESFPTPEALHQFVLSTSDEALAEHVTKVRASLNL